MPQTPPDWSPRPAPGLPEGLILYDGVCVLCSRWVRFVIDSDPAGRWSFVPVQSPFGREIASRLGIDPDEPETNAVVRGGLAHLKLDAALAVLGALPGWRWTRAARLLPRPMRDALYDRIARNRYRLFGRLDACPAPSGELARRVRTAA